MSQHKKKKMKQPTRLRTLVASLMLIMPAVHAANDTEFSQRPLVGVAASFAPHIALALSVEFPTAGAAYSDTTLMSLNNAAKSSPITEKYLGYFDNNKCYKYNHQQNYFYPSSKAVSESGKHGLCNTKGETEEFSGNMMNFMTMTAIDIFRSVMTGGNRAIRGNIEGWHGPFYNVEAAAYQGGDTPTETFLRRAKVQYGQNANGVYRIVDRQLDVTNNIETAKRLVPHYFVNTLMKDVIKGEDSENNRLASNFGKPRSWNLRSVDFNPMSSGGTTLTSRLNTNITVTQGPQQAAGEYDIFSDNYLHFFNYGMTVQIVRKVTKGIRHSNGSLETDTYSLTHEQRLNGLFEYGLGAAPNTIRQRPQYYAMTDASKITNSAAAAETQKWEKRFNLVVKVCDPSVGLEENCKPYGSVYKPEGLLQEYTRSHRMRFATFGYLNNSNVEGGALRSRMKELIDDPDNGDPNNQRKHAAANGKVYGNEWDTKTGQLVLNPDTTDATASGVDFSGTINYLNKFGDWEGYRQEDPAGELYETALTYLRGTKVGTGVYQPASNLLTKQIKDNFPAIYDWDDPYKRGVETKAQHCHANSIIFIGDTNTHKDDGVATANPKVTSYLTRLFAHELGANHGLTHSTNFGSNSSPAYMAGLAYWARTNNIRPDLPHTDERPINSTNFIIDVVENGNYKASPLRNTYYLAAKYGGFNLNNERLKTELVDTADNNKALPIQRNSWTDDEVGSSSISQFTKGTPRNFAIANNPAAMKKALGDAIASGAALNNPSQAATGLSTGLGDIVDVSETGEDYLLQSTYDFANLTGDVVILKPNFITKTGKLELVPHKSIGDTVTQQYHGSGYAARKVFTTHNGSPAEFNGKALSGIQDKDMPTGVSRDDLANYILGDNSKESGALRKRKGLLGTVINSTATPILKAKNLLGCEPFDSAALTRDVYYTAAANDGMLHIFDRNGNEKMAYMAGTALDKLDDFAKIGFQHQYLNDGTPVIQDVCLNNQPNTVLVGTTGRGGNAVYALNVTDISNPSTNNVMWEFTDADLGLTVSKPVITKGSDGKQYAIVSSGYHTDGAKPDNGYMFILDIATGSHWKVKLGTAGVGAPFVYDGDNDGIGDKIFVGDSDGKVWQLNRVDNPGNSAPFTVAYNDNPLFTPAGNLVRPITGAPYAEMVNNKLTVVVGTGRYFSEKDLDSQQQNYAYGLFADDKNPIVDNGGDGIENNLLPQEIQADITSKTELDASKTAVYSVTSNKITDSHQGWRLKLITGANIAADSLIRQRQVATFVFARNTDSLSAACVRGANSGLVQVDVKNGGRFPKALVDTNRDGKFDDKDSSDVGMIEHIGVNTPNASFFRYRDPITGKIKTVSLAKSGLKEDEQAETPLRDLETEAGVRRISWREIF